MEIKFLGKNAFLIKGKKETVLVNPDEEMINKNNSRIIVRNEAKIEVDDKENQKVIVMGPGEYEIGGVEIYGFSGGKKETFYSVVADGVIIGILGKLQEALSDKRAEKISGVDVLMANISNGGSKSIMTLAKKWGANYVVPVGYEPGDEAIKKFMDETDVEGLEPAESLKIDKDNLPDGTEVVILKESK